jgi:hypothetical protein
LKSWKTADFDGPGGLIDPLDGLFYPKIVPETENLTFFLKTTTLTR